MATWNILPVLFSILSMLFYGIVYYPQLRLMCANKTSNGISLWMLMMWLQADALSLVGTILLQLSINLLIIGWYHFFIGSITLVTAFYFKEERSWFEYLFILSSFITSVVVCSVLSTYIHQPEYWIGDVVGWLTAFVYLIGRVPQIVMNIQRKSTNGLSILMYVFAILGNTCFAASIMTTSDDRAYLRINLPWLILCAGDIILDLVVIVQSRAYKSRDETRPGSESV